MSSDPACAEPDNRCADTRTANTVATPLVFGDLPGRSRDGGIGEHSGERSTQVPIKGGIDDLYNRQPARPTCRLNPDHPGVRPR
jgi:hypothetical protein